AWLPDADWSQLQWLHLHGDGEHRFVAPYPASLLKLMVAVGVGLAVEAGHTSWAQMMLPLESMVVVSDNDATDTCVALLHRCGMVDPLNRRFQALGLHTLQLNGTRPDGGWRNADGAGVGQIHMTAWDTARLLWLLDTQAPPAPWLPAGERLLQVDTCERLHAVLSRQERNEVLSSGSLQGVHGWLPGFPDAPAFAHKTGTTNNYASDAGILRSDGIHAIVALITSLGRRYAPHERCATTWHLPALGAAVHRLLKETT
ncbi:MAG: serine hydrolase, partial [Rubrivivax sp.]|nr:serine hydrolase [Rubrivivax sp.]